MIKRYYTNLIGHYASVSIGGKAVIVSKLKKQPSDVIYFEPIGGTRTEIQRCFPIGTIIGMPETWWKPRRGDIKYKNSHIIYKDYENRDNCLNGRGDAEYFCYPDGEEEELKWRFPTTMPNSVIRLLWKMTGTRVCRIKDLDTNPEDCRLAGLASQSASKMIGVRWQNIRDWFISRYGQEDWNNNVYVEVTDIERIEKP